MEVLENSFASRDQMIAYLRGLAPWASGEASDITGGRVIAMAQLARMKLGDYAESRNYGTGSVSRLSPYIHHGVLSLNEVRHHALENDSDQVSVYRFIQELAWRDFWQRVLKNHPDWAWSDIEPYKTGFFADDYSDQLPEDISRGETGISCIDDFIKELVRTGYLHNHARMYIASYVVHFRRIKWQAGAAWFLHHLLDGDLASNNLSWQWIASTFSNKPYIFNLENVAKYFDGLVDTRPSSNRDLDASYDELRSRLFPNVEEAE